MDAISTARLQLVNPRLAELIIQLNERMLSADNELRVTQGLRSWNDQGVLWSRGRQRQPDGTWVVVDASQIVTKAQPGHSWHNFGLAVDVVPMYLPTGENMPDWNVNHPAWRTIVTQAESLGLVSGSCWHTMVDWPHLQLTGKFPVSPDDEVRQLFLDGGMQAIWEEAGIVV